jgi:hypothetical protein
VWTEIPLHISPHPPRLGFHLGNRALFFADGGGGIGQIACNNKGYGLSARGVTAPIAAASRGDDPRSASSRPASGPGRA